MTIDLRDDPWMTPPLTLAQKEKLLILLQNIGLKVSNLTLKDTYKFHEEYPRICRTIWENEDFQITCTIKNPSDTQRIEISIGDLVELIKNYNDKSE